MTMVIYVNCLQLWLKKVAISSSGHHVFLSRDCNLQNSSVHLLYHQDGQKFDFADEMY
jgi:hypothetical protein